MDEKDLNMTNGQLLERLGVIKNGKILIAGIMLFHQIPEKWINGVYIKIEFFESDSEISYMDEIHGSLVSQADKVIDLIFTKYLKVDISYEGVTRVETYPFPKAAIREAVYNTIVHKNYATNALKNIIEKNSPIVFEFLKQYPEATQKNMIESLDISKRTLERIISQLKKNGYIERVGNNHLGYWKILK